MDEPTKEESTATPPSTSQPKTLQKLGLRTAILLFVVAGLFVAYMLLKQAGLDVDLPATADTRGMIAAIQYHDRGTQAVIIKPDGEIIPSPGYTEGAQDRDLVWRPDGNRLFFGSDREERTFHMFRWNPASDRVERRSFGSRGHQFPSFAYTANADEAKTVLVATGGRLIDLDPRDGSAEQVLPPSLRREEMQGEGEGEGAVDAFEKLYKDLGTSFKKARYLLGKKWIAAVMQREQGQVLVIQHLEAQGGTFQAPIPIAAGDRVEFDVEPRTGTIVVVTSGFEFPGDVPPEFIKDGRVTKPFEHAVAAINVQDPSATVLIAVSSDRSSGFTSPVLSPDGTALLLVTGRYSGEGEIAPEQLVLVPVESGGGSQGRLVRQGAIFDPVWSPDSRTIAFWTTGDDGRRDIRLIAPDGTGERSLTAGKGSFARPTFSPQFQPVNASR